MIQGEYKGTPFKIDTGVLVGGPREIIHAFSLIASDPPGPSEGDPDYVLFQRLQSQFSDIVLIKYVPMKIDPDVVY